MHDMEDTWMWKHTQSGMFSVKSACYIEWFDEHKKKSSSSTHGSELVWEWLWKAIIQPKVKLFGWKVLHNGIPVLENLDHIRPRCGEKTESLEHMLLFCVNSKNVWYLSPLRIDVSRAGGGTFREWVETLEGNKKDDEWWALFWMICWNIWLGKNAWVFEGKKRDFKEIVDRTVRGARELVAFTEVSERMKPRNTHGKGWVAPPEGCTKSILTLQCLKENRSD